MGFRMVLISLTLNESSVAGLYDRNELHCHIYDYDYMAFFNV